MMVEARLKVSTVTEHFFPYLHISYILMVFYNIQALVYVSVKCPFCYVHCLPIFCTIMLVEQNVHIQMNICFSTGYLVEKKKAGGDWEPVNKFPATGESMTVPDLEEGEQYEFRVAAVTKAGPGEKSMATSPVTVKAKQTKPGSPEDLKVDDITAEGCKLSWTPPAKDGGAPITDYIVEQCEEGSPLWEPVQGNVNGTSVPVKGLEKGKKYKFRVKAKNRAGVGEPLETDRAILAKNPFGKWCSHLHRFV